MTTQTAEQPIGRLPMRRMIVLAFVGAAIVGGIYAARAGFGTSAATATTTADRGGEWTQSIVDADGDRWICAGATVSAENCSAVEGAEPGPIQPLGYRSDSAAREGCTAGTVSPLYRQGRIVGYGCFK